ncbi:hypothetical protein LZ554_009012 [Drepanopeziza brunnea f. sp. 'monogermtubi']|nr:hypothetical protein LZ554_009012 [Drepanopeziza brunnea f. sp. 'monogermtubi']
MSTPAPAPAPAGCQPIPLCAVCEKTASLWCKECKSIHYCSAACENADRPLHQLLCPNTATLHINNPRPAAEDGNLYKLAFFFPAKMASRS